MTGALPWKKNESVEWNARRVLPQLAHDYFVKGRKVASDKPNFSRLHRFRLRTKRFRYLLELFGQVYGPSLDEWLALIKPIQEVLGQINDCVTVQERFANVPLAARFLRRRALRKAREFERMWKRFDRMGEERRWIRYLSTLRETEPAIDGNRLARDERRRA